jgi:aminodeoxyfutalosine synthase
VKTIAEAIAGCGVRIGRERKAGAAVTATGFDERLARVEAGDALTADEIRQLGASPDIVSLGMLADTLRRRMRGTTATYLRVATCALEGSFSEAVPPAARELCITGEPETAAAAIDAVRSARAVAGARTVSALAWADIERLGPAYDGGIAALLSALREAGLDSLRELPLDTLADAGAVVDALKSAGFSQLRLTIDASDPGARADLWLRAAELQARTGIIQTLNALPMTLRTFRPTTGYEDVRSVALARLAAPNIPSIQVDWTRYGPKLAQVALTFGADDVWGVSASDAAPEGRRRAAVEEIRRNIIAAGFEPVERDGRYGVTA